MVLKIITDVKDLEGLIPEWQALQANAEGATLFTSPTWSCAWIEAFGRDKDVRVFVGEDGGQLSGVMPLIRARVRRRPWFSMHHIQQEDLRFMKAAHRYGCIVPVRQLSGPANAESGTIRAGWSVRPGHSRCFLRLVFQHLRDERDWDMLCLPGVQHDHTDEVVLAAEEATLPVGRHAALCRLHTIRARPWEEFFAAQSSHFRQRFKVAERALKKHGPVSCDVVTDVAAIEEALDRLFSVARRSWKETGGAKGAGAIPLTAEAARFYRALSLEAAKESRCQVFLLVVGGTTVAGMLSVVDGTVMYLLQMYYLPAVASGSPGRLLFREAIRWAAAHGMTLVDTNGNSALVQLFADGVQQFDQVFIYRRSGLSHALYRSASAVEWLRGRLMAGRRRPIETAVTEACGSEK